MPRVLIAGAGIGGLAAALTLARVGASVTVLERAPIAQESGAGLQLSPNACRVLRRLDVLDAVIAAAFRPAAIRVRVARTAATLSLMPLDDAERRWGAPYLVVRRADLRGILLEATRTVPQITLHLGTSLAGFGTTPSGVTATAAQGTLKRAFEADLLIGADGVRSAVRTRLLGGALETAYETGRTAWRSVVETRDLDPVFAAPETGLWLGRNAHLVHYPLGGGRTNVVAITRDTSTPDPNDIWAKPGDRAVVERRFARWHRAPRSLIAAAGAWTTWPLFDRAPLPSWNAGPVALLGDAAHPILPFLAQGAAQAIEDAAALAEAVAGTLDVPTALARYSEARVPRATRVQDNARQLGRIYHLGGPTALARDASMRLMGPGRLLARYDWLYGA